MKVTSKRGPGPMAEKDKEEKFEVEGTVIEALPNI